MAKIFDSSFDVLSDGEYFWHATTIKNVLKMIQYDSGGLQPIGDGQLGAGFYVTGTRSDYQKGMARRSREDDEAPLFLFHVRTKGFYQLTPAFLSSWDTSSVGAADFSAVTWYKEGKGAVGAPERAGFIPSVTGQRTEFKYGEYRQERMPGTEIAAKSAKDSISFMETLWGYARTNTFPLASEVEHFGPVAAHLPQLGARKIFLRVLLELAFKSEASVANSAIVGVKVFSPTTGPIPLQFKYQKKSYDLSGTVKKQNKLKTDDDPMNFHKEAWLDLGKMLEILKA